MMLLIVADMLFLFPLNSEGQDEYENDGFIVDDIEDEEEQDEEERAESDDERQKKKKRKKKSVLYCFCVFFPPASAFVEVELI